MEGAQKASEGRAGEGQAERLDWRDRIEGATRAVKLASTFAAVMAVAEPAQAEGFAECATDASHQYVASVVEQSISGNEALARAVAEHMANKELKAEAKAELAAGLAIRAAAEAVHDRYLETGTVSLEDPQKDDIPNILELRMNKWIAGNNALTSGLKIAELKLENKPIRKELFEMLAVCKYELSNREEGDPVIEPLSELIDDIKEELHLDQVADAPGV